MPFIYVRKRGLIKRGSKFGHKWTRSMRYGAMGGFQKHSKRYDRILGRLS